MKHFIINKYFCSVAFIRRRSDYIIGFITPAIGPNKSRKLTRLIAPAHNIRGKVWIKKKHAWLYRQTVIVCEAMYVVFHSNFAACIVCRRDKPCECPGFVWTDCRGNKSYYVITSPANSKSMLPKIDSIRMTTKRAPSVIRSY